MVSRDKASALVLPFLGVLLGVGPGILAQAPAPAAITLEEAIRRAQANEPGYARAAAESRAAALDRSVARAGLLPEVALHSQVLYTQPNGLNNQAGQGTGEQPSPRFISNNAVREYAGQAVVSETLGAAGVADLRRADARAAMAAAALEIERRGLAAAVTELFYGARAADHRVAIATEAESEAADFVRLTGERERQREAAHADVVRAELDEEERSRALSDARLAAERARLELGVLLFPDPRTPFTLSAPDETAPLAPRSEVEQAAATHNPELRSALAAVAESDAEVLAARARYLPSLDLNFTYGIDAPQFAVSGPENVRNLGYSASAGVDLPVWDWLRAQQTVRQSRILRDAVRVSVTATERRLIARLDEAYAEARTALDQLASLDRSVATAAESLRLTRLRYTGGEATALEVVDAQNGYASARNAREDGRVRYQAALADLQTLTGTM